MHVMPPFPGIKTFNEEEEKKEERKKKKN